MQTESKNIAATCFALARGSGMGQFLSCPNHAKRRTSFSCRLTPPLKGVFAGGDTLVAEGGSDCYLASIDPHGQPEVFDRFPPLELLACQHVPVQQSARRQQGRSKPPDRSVAPGLWSAWLRPWGFLYVAFGCSSRADPGAQARQSLCSSTGQCFWPQAPRPDPPEFPELNQQLRLCHPLWPAPAFPRQSKWLNRCQVCPC